MSEYIRKEDVLNLPQSIERNLCGEIVERSIDVKDIESLEPADVAPVVHGHWEYIDDTYCGFEDTDVRCSVCKTTTNIKRFRKTKWCPDCGAKMDREE